MDSIHEPDWTAIAIAIRLVLSGMPSRGKGFTTVVEWWDSKLKSRTHSEWRELFERVRSMPESLSESNMGYAMKKLGVEPVVANYRMIVNAARKLARPRCREVK